MKDVFHVRFAQAQLHERSAVPDIVHLGHKGALTQVNVSKSRTFAQGRDVTNPRRLQVEGLEGAAHSEPPDVPHVHAALKPQVL